MGVRTGTASQVTGSAGSGSTSVTVPADATAAVAFWAHFNNLGAATLSTKTLGGNAFTTRAENACKTPASDNTGTGVATLTNLPGTGTQTFAWAWSDSDPRDEGGGILIVWVKDVDLAAIFRDADTNSQNNLTTQASVTIDSATDDLVIGMAQLFADNGAALTTNAATTFVDDWAVNHEHSDGGQWTAGASTTTCATTGDKEYNTMAAISLKNGAVPSVTPLSVPVARHALGAGRW